MAQNNATDQPQGSNFQPLSITDQRDKQLTLVRTDIIKLAQVDIEKPFTSIEDAVERLLPFHLLASQEPDEQDLEDADCLDGYLLASRQQVWEDHVLERCATYAQRAEDVRQQIMQMQATAEGPGRPRPERQAYALLQAVQVLRQEKEKLQSKYQRHQAQAHQQQQQQQQAQLQQQLLQQQQQAQQFAQQVAALQAQGHVQQQPGS